MKKIILILLTGFFLFSCATMQKFRASDVTEIGIKYKYGSKQGVKIGETVKAFQRSSTGKGFKSDPVGTLTIVSVEPEFSIMKKDGEFHLDESVSFGRE